MQALLAQLDDKCTGAGAKRALEGAAESGRNTKRRRKCWGAMTWQRVANMRAEGMELEKTGGGIGFNAGCSSVETISRSEERQWLEWTVESTDRAYCIGLSHQDTDVHYASIDYAIFIGKGARYTPFEKGSRTQAICDCAAGDRFKIIVTGDVVTHEHNDRVFYTSTKKPTFPLLVDTAFGSGAKVSDIKLHTV
jgi:hypothetical protein